MIHRNSIAVFFTCLTAFAMGATANAQCRSETIDTSGLRVSQYYASFKPRRIVLVTTHNRHGRISEQTVFAKSLSLRLSQVAGFETVVASQPICAGELPQNTGTFDEHQILQLAKAYRADAVLFCDAGLVSGFDPMQASPSIVMIHASEAIALLSVKTHLALSDPAVHNQYANFTSASLQPASASLYRHSPARFIDFSAQKIATIIGAAH